MDEKEVVQLTLSRRQFNLVSNASLSTIALIEGLVELSDLCLLRATIHRSEITQDEVNELATMFRDIHHAHNTQPKE